MDGRMNFCAGGKGRSPLVERRLICASCSWAWVLSAWHWDSSCSPTHATRTIFLKRPWRFSWAASSSLLAWPLATSWRRSKAAGVTNVLMVGRDNETATDREGVDRVLGGSAVAE